MLVSSGLAGAAGADSLPRAGGTLRVAVPASRAEAFFATKPDRPPGFDEEILRGFVNLHKMSLVVVVSPTWDGLADLLVRGGADLIAGGYTDTLARRKVMDFSVGVFPTRDVVVTRRPHWVRSLDELRVERVVTHRGTSMVDALAAAGVPASQIVYVTEGKEEVPGVLKAGGASAGVLGLEVAILASKEDPELQLGVFLGEPQQLAYGIRKTDRDLRQALDAYLLNFRRTASWNRLVVKYFGDAAIDILRRARGEAPED